jgi:hypothetical protein
METMFTLYWIAFPSSVKKHLFNMECTNFRSRVKQHLPVAIIPLKIAFLKGTDRCLFTSVWKSTWYSVSVSLMFQADSGWVDSGWFSNKVYTSSTPGSAILVIRNQEYCMFSSPRHTVSVIYIHTVVACQDFIAAFLRNTSPGLG